MKAATSSQGAVFGLPGKSIPQSASSVIAFLLAPLPDAELHDPEIVRLEQRSAREAQKRAEEYWHLCYLRVVAAHEEYKLSATRRHILSLEKSPEKDQAALIEAKLLEAYRQRVFRQMFIPAVHKRHVAWKRENLKRLDVPSFAENIPKLRTLIDAEEIGLTRRRQSCK